MRIDFSPIQFAPRTQTGFEGQPTVNRGMQNKFFNSLRRVSDYDGFMYPVTWVHK